jgi:capsular exopolysaccharide synthesis family protein
MRQPRSPVSEAFRSLRTNLEFASVEKPIRTLIVTSTGPGEGKTTIATNLSAIFSHAKKRVVLMDADMRRPSIHRMFGMSNRKGLSNLFIGSEPTSNIGRVRKDLPNLLIITSGDQPPNPAELLGSEKMGQILNQLGKHVDLTIIDTPPSLVADAQILAARADAILFVIQPGVTRTDTAKAALDSLKRSGTRIVGVVMNRIPKNRDYYYGGYKYYSSYGRSKYYTDKSNEDLEKTKPIQTSSSKTARGQTSFSRHQSSAVTKSVESEKASPAESQTYSPAVKKLFANMNLMPDPTPVEAKPQKKQEFPDSEPGTPVDWPIRRISRD